MSYSFKNAIIRLPNKSIENGLSSQNLHPQYKVIAEEHSNYIKAIKEAGLQIKLLESLEEYPDSIFVEDPALTYKSNVIILNPFDSSRNGEKNIIENEIKDLFDNILFVEDGFVEGGDILNINNHFIIGLSNRTNQLGAENLSTILQGLDATVEICKTPDDILHFKSECSVIDDDTILVSNKMAQLNYLKSNEIKKTTMNEIIETCNEHVYLLKKFKNDKVVINLSKKHLSYYLKGFKDSSLYRKEVMRSETIEEIEKVISNII